MTKRLVFPLLLILSTFAFTACDNDPDPDDVGDEVEDSLEDVEDVED